MHEEANLTINIVKTRVQPQSLLLNKILFLNPSSIYTDEDGEKNKLYSIDKLVKRQTNIISYFPYNKEALRLNLNFQNIKTHSHIVRRKDENK